jgi:hypothetical protein
MMLKKPGFSYSVKIMFNLQSITQQSQSQLSTFRNVIMHHSLKFSSPRNTKKSVTQDEERNERNGESSRNSMIRGSYVTYNGQVGQEHAWVCKYREIWEFTSNRRAER